MLRFREIRETKEEKELRGKNVGRFANCPLAKEAANKVFDKPIEYYDRLLFQCQIDK